MVKSSTPGRSFPHREAAIIYQFSAAVLGAWLAAIVVPVCELYAQEQLNSNQIQFFEKFVRPVLVKECCSCHSASAKEIEGGLTLDTREGIRKGGDTGPAVVPGNVQRSLFIKALKRIDDDLLMPPKKKLAPDVIAVFEQWIAMGAPDPRDGAATVADK